MDDDRMNEKELFEKLNQLLEKQNRFEEKLTALNLELEKVKRALPTHIVETGQKPEPASKEIKAAVRIGVKYAINH